MNKKEIKKEESTRGLKEHLIDRGWNKDHRLTAVYQNAESDVVAYALQGYGSSPDFPFGAIVAGVHLEGKFTEKYFSSEPIEKISTIKNLGTILVSVKTKSESSMLKFNISELEGGKRE